MALRWGIACVGLISTDYVIALGTLPETDHRVLAAAARDLSRAQTFATEHGIPKAYGSYDELAKDPDVDVVYIGSINTEHHLRLGKLFLESGKSVVCEKPLCMNKKQVQELVDLARSKKLFLMEAICSRLNPVYKKIRQDIDDGKIGEPFLVQANLGVKLDHIERVVSRALGGSALLDIGVYALQFALFVLGRPSSVKAIGNANNEGIDESLQVLLEYPGGKAAVLCIHTKIALSNDARISGTGGNITVKNPFWTPLEADINGEIFKITLPEGKKPFCYRNSAAFRFEAEEVRQCIKNGLTESPSMSLDESLLLAELEDEIRRQVGIVFDQDS